MNSKYNFRDQLTRPSVFRPFFHACLEIASSCRLPLEVFMRRDFGVRYFNLPAAISLSIGLVIASIFAMAIMSAIFMEVKLLNFITWYLFIAAFIGASIWHHRDRSKKPKDEIYKKYSKSSGELVFAKAVSHYTKTKFSIRTMECLIEPSGFFVLGVLLAFLGQYLGFLLIFTSLIYCFSYIGAYHEGDNFVLDIIDNQILAKEFHSTFKNKNEGTTSPSGLRFRGRRLFDEATREEIANAITNENSTLI